MVGINARPRVIEMARNERGNHAAAGALDHERPTITSWQH
jgi:hypothetical protein